MHNCPRCKLAIQPERLMVIPVICDHCGFSESQNETTTEKSDSRLYYGIGGSMLLGFLLLASSVELRWLQTRDFIGLSSVSSLERLAQICTELAKPACVEHALGRQTKLDPSRAAKYAEFLLSRNKAALAERAMRKLIASGKADDLAYTVYARTLAETGRTQEAARYFEHLMRSKNAPVELAHTYVRYLTHAKRYDQALAVILRIRQREPNAMPVEYRVISEMRSSANNRFVAGKR